jgi:hypothetical protein
MTLPFRPLLWIFAGAGAYWAAENYALLIEFCQKIPATLKNYDGLITAIATVFIAWLTLELMKENRRLRKAGTEPEVIAYLLPHPDGHGGINFILANIGQGPARNVRFELEYDKDDFSSHGVLLANDPRRKRMSILPQGEKIAVLFGISSQLAGVDKKHPQPPLKPFIVKITYDDLSGKSRISEQTIDISQYAGLAGLFAEPPSIKIAKALEKILSTQKWIDTTTTDSTVRQKTKAVSQSETSQ